MGWKAGIETVHGQRRGSKRPIFSPDGRWLAYSSRESDDQVYMRPFLAPEDACSTDGGFTPTWSRIA